MPDVVARHGDYLEIFTRHLRDSVESYPDESVRGLELVVDGYEVREGKFPEVEGYDAVMMTGSGEFDRDREAWSRERPQENASPSISEKYFVPLRLWAHGICSSLREQ